MKNMTIEEASALLKEIEVGMPKAFTVRSVAYAKVTDTYYVKWFDESQIEAYNDGVAQMKAAGAKSAYSFTPSYAFSAIWFNEDETGKETPATAILEPKEVSELSKNSDMLVLLDQA